MRAVYDMVKPTRGVIPIHSQRPEAFRELLPDANIRLLTDGEIFTL